MSIFTRMLGIGKAEAHAMVDKLEDPVKMTEQGIRDLKKDLANSIEGLAEVKGIAIRTRRDAENKKKEAKVKESQAMKLLQKAQNGGMDMATAERLATEALNQKEQLSNEAKRLNTDAKQHEARVDQLQGSVNKIKSAITQAETDLTSLKARSKTAEATKKINKQIANVDSSGTMAMLERMKNRVEDEEAEAIAYGEIADAGRSVDDEIQDALEDNSGGSAALLEMKRKMGMLPAPEKEGELTND